MASTGDFRNGMVIALDGDAYRIVEFMHVKPGKGGAFVRTKLKRVETGAVIERTFRAGEKVEEIRLERVNAQFLYSDDDFFYFMNMETYDQFPLASARVGETRRYMKENEQIQVLFRDGQAILVELPTHVNLAVTATDPGAKGDTAQGATKPATLETSLVVTVPLFINEGDVLRIDTRTGEYVERVNK